VSYAQVGCKNVITNVCTPTPPTCTQECAYITDPPSCRTVCTPNPPHCTDVIHTVCPPTTVAGNLMLMIPPDTFPDEGDQINPCDLVMYGPDQKCEVVNGWPIISELNEIQELEHEIDLVCAVVTPALGYKCINVNGVPKIVREDGFVEEVNKVPGFDQCAWFMTAPGFECVIENETAVIRKVIGDEPVGPEIDPFCTVASFFNDPRCHPTIDEKFPLADGMDGVMCLSSGLDGLDVCGEFRDIDIVK